MSITEGPEPRRFLGDPASLARDNIIIKAGDLGATGTFFLQFVNYEPSRSRQIMHFPVDNFGTVVGENPTPYEILALWAVNGLSVVYWVGNVHLSVSLSALAQCS